jgi:hypothetical protein
MHFQIEHHMHGNVLHLHTNRKHHNIDIALHRAIAHAFVARSDDTWRRIATELLSHMRLRVASRYHVEYMLACAREEHVKEEKKNQNDGWVSRDQQRAFG